MSSVTSETPAEQLQSILDRVDRIGDFDHFPGVDELVGSFDALVEKYPELISRRRIGTSRLGEPLWMYSVGAGSASALIYAGVHPNEPIGFCTVLQLATELCTDPEFAASSGCRWHLVPDIDPDGTRLNEGWYDGPFDRVFYARHFYRPAPAEQVEWSFPLAYKDAYFDQVIPETFALMRVMDEIRPDLAVALHNGELGGVYYYLSRNIDGAVEALHAIAAHAGLPLDRGEPESPVVDRYGPAVFETISTEREYDHRERLGLSRPEDGSGGSSADYAARHGTLSLVAELPYWTHPAADDQSLTDHRYADLLRAAGDELDRDMQRLAGILDRANPHLSKDSQLVRASRAFVPSLVVAAEAERRRAGREDPQRLATVAEAFSLTDRNRCFRLRYGGMLLRAVEAEAARGAAPASLHRLSRELGDLYLSWQREAAEHAADLEQLPIRKLVGVQYAATLALLAALRIESGAGS